MKTRPSVHIAVAALAAFLSIVPARAATITVTSFADDGVGCTLRKAMANALAAGPANAECAAGATTNTVQLAAGTYRVTGGRIPMDGPTTTSTTILGPGPGQTVVDAAGNSVIFDNCQVIGGTLALTLKGMTLTGGRNGSDGGAVCVNSGTTLTVDTTAFIGNHSNGFGGAIFSQASHNTVIDSSFESNSAISGAGAIWGRNSTDIRGSYFGQNDGGSTAGALYLWNDGALNTIDRSTFWGNRANYGSVFQGGNNTMEITSSTVVGNQALAGTGVFWTYSGSSWNVRLTNSILAGNTNLDGSPGGDCTGLPLSTGGHTIAGDLVCGVAIGGPGFATIGAVTIAATPADHGGPTKTLVPPNPPLDAAAKGDCSPDGGVDQRGVPRPYACTIGAYELVAATPASAPSIVATASALDGFIDVVISPGDAGGRTITGHVVQCGAASAGTAGTTASVGPLQPGIAVACRAFAQTSLGDGTASPDSVVTPLGKPEPPIIGVAVAGVGSVLVNYTAPANDGGLSIFLYSATCGAVSFARVNGAINVTGLPNGVPVTCTVTATNARGTSIASAPSNLVTPGTVPDAPTAVVATAAGLSVTVIFDAPAFDGGLVITGYRAVCNPGNVTSAVTPAAPAIVNVGADGNFSCVVIATNAAGDSVPSAPASVLVDATAPVVVSSVRVGAPSVPAATSQQFTVTFSEPVGGVDIGDFAITSSGSASATIASVAGSGAVYAVTASLGAGGGTVRLDVVANGSISDARSNVLAGGFTSGQVFTVVPPMRFFSGPSPTGTGTITASFTGGGAACGFGTAQFVPLTGHARSPPEGSAPAGVTFPHGLFDFTTTNCDPGGTITMTVTYPRDAAGPLTYYKYGPTPSDPAAHWYVLPSSRAGTTIEFSITDGALGDDDLAANGTLVDQGGPGGAPGAAIAVPTLSQWMMVLLALLMAAVAIGPRRPDASARRSVREGTATP